MSGCVRESVIFLLLLLLPTITTTTTARFLSIIQHNIYFVARQEKKQDFFLETIFCKQLFEQVPVILYIIFWFLKDSFCLPASSFLHRNNYFENNWQKIFVLANSLSALEQCRNFVHACETFIKQFQAFLPENF